MAKLRQVIEAEERIGAGTPDDPVRMLTCFYDLDGTLLWSKDPWRDQRGSLNEFRERMVAARTPIACAVAP